MNTIYSSYWIIKKYKSNGVPFWFLRGISELNMLNAIYRAITRKIGDDEITQHSETHWEFTDVFDGNIHVVKSIEIPTVPEGVKFSVKDERMESTKRPPRQQLPDKISFSPVQQTFL